MSQSGSERPIESLPNSNAATVGSPSRPTSSAWIRETSRAASSRPPSLSLSGEISTHIYGRCPLCHYIHHKRHQRLLDAKSHTEILCANCGYKIIGLGGDSRHGSFTIKEQSRRHTTIATMRAIACQDHPLDGESSPKPLENEHLPTVAESGGDSDSGRPEPGLDAGGVVDSELGLAPKPSIQMPAFHSPPRPRNIEDRKRHRLIKKLFAYYGYDINLERRSVDTRLTAQNSQDNSFMSFFRRIFSRRKYRRPDDPDTSEVSPRSSGEHREGIEVHMQKDEDSLKDEKREEQRDSSGPKTSPLRLESDDSQPGRATITPDVPVRVFCMCSSNCPCNQKESGVASDAMLIAAERGYNELEFAAIGAGFQPDRGPRRDSLNSGLSVPRSASQPQREQSLPRTETPTTPRSPVAEGSQFRDERATNAEEVVHERNSALQRGDQVGISGTATPQSERPPSGLDQFQRRIGSWGSSQASSHHAGQSSTEIWSRTMDSDVFPPR